MKNVYLCPNYLKPIGWLILIPSLITGIYFVFVNEFSWDFLSWSVPWNSGKTDNFTNELLMLLILISALIVAFSKTKEEDEYVQKIRLESLLWSMYVNYGVLFLGIVGIYDINFLNVMLLNMFTPLLIFIGRFNYYYFKR